MSSIRRREMGPWRGDQLNLLVIGHVVGASLVVVGAWVAIAQDTPGMTLGWLNLAIGGLIVSGTANMLWLLVGRRGLRDARRFVFHPLLGDGDMVPPSDEDLVHVPGTIRVHRAGCLLALGKGAIPVSDPDGYRPCEVCQP